jgi:hypothetical protein
MRLSIALLPVTMLALIPPGCSSSRSTLLTRNECNTGWNKVAHLHGTPITLRVPTHLRVYIYEKYYIENVRIAGVTRWQRVELPCVYDFGTELLYTDKIFTTDFIRPAAGPFDLDVSYTSDQYPSQVKQKLTDETLKQVAEIVGKLPSLLVPAPLAKQTSETGLSGGPVLEEIKSVVAANVFEIDDPNFEISLTEFIQTHLNGRATNPVQESYGRAAHQPVYASN